MKNKKIKIVLFILMWVIFGAVLYLMYGPDGTQTRLNKEQQERIKDYVKTEATIISQEGNGRVGKGARTIWTIQFKDGSGALRTTTMDQSTFLGKDDGAKINIYYDPKDPAKVSSEESYDEIMN